MARSPYFDIRRAVTKGMQRIVDSEEKPMASRFAHYSWDTLPEEDKKGAVEIIMQEIKRIKKMRGLI